MPRNPLPLLALLAVALLPAGCDPGDLLPGAAAPPGAAAGAAAATPTGPPPPSVLPGCAPAPGCYAEPELTGTFDVAAVAEASGLAASMRNPGLLYVLDDGPETEGVEVLRPDGTLLGRLRLTGLDPRDTESLAVGPCGPGDPATCLYVADSGDNVGGRETVTITRAVEPDLAAGVPAEPIGADAAVLRYPDGIHDSEALLVGADAAVHLVTKAVFDEATGATGPTRLYRAAAWADGDLEALGDLPVPQPASGLLASFVGNVVTGGDARGGRVLLRTYDAVFAWTAPDAAAPLAGLAGWPVAEVPSASQRQPEAVAWAVDRCGFYAVSEGSGDIWFTGCR